MTFWRNLRRFFAFRWLRPSTGGRSRDSHPQAPAPPVDAVTDLAAPSAEPAPGPTQLAVVESSAAGPPGRTELGVAPTTEALTPSRVAVAILDPAEVSADAAEDDPEETTPQPAEPEPTEAEAPPLELVFAQAGWPTNDRPGGVVTVTTSSNLGWPADPETSTNQEHLGWAEMVYGPLTPSVESAPTGLREAGEEDSTATGSGTSATSGTASPADAEAASETDSSVVEEPGAPVDNSDPLTTISGDSVRENGSDGAGDKHVDERSPHGNVSRETDEREELAAVLPTSGDDTPVLQELAENARRRIQLSGQKFPQPTAPRVLTVANQKGGVGKTTTTVNIAAAMAQGGLKVLVIDLDPQGNASTALGIDHHADVVSIYDVLVDGTPLMDVIQPCTTVEGLYCAPATIDLAGAEIELVSLVARETRLQKAIRAANEIGHEFDYILIDCPPSLGLLTVNAMVAATEVFIPIQCEYYALEGLSQLLKNIELVRAHLNPALHVSTILLTMYDGRTRLSAQVADEVREHFPSEVLRTTVPRSVRVSEAPSFGETVMTYDPNSSGALSYLEAASEIADRGAAGRT